MRGFGAMVHYARTQLTSPCVEILWVQCPLCLRPLFLSEYCLISTVRCVRMIIFHHLLCTLAAFDLRRPTKISIYLATPSWPDEELKPSSEARPRPRPNFSVLRLDIPMYKSTRIACLRSPLSSRSQTTKRDRFRNTSNPPRKHPQLHISLSI